MTNIVLIDRETGAIEDWHDLDIKMQAIYGLKPRKTRSGWLKWYKIACRERTIPWMCGSPFFQLLSDRVEVKWWKDAPDHIRTLCGQWHSGQASALYSCASSGHASVRLLEELEELRDAFDEAPYAVILRLGGPSELDRINQAIKWLLEP